MTKNCGDCRFYAKETEHCKLKGIGWKFATDTPCSGFTPRKPITNGDKIIAGGNRAVAEFQQQCSCDNCVYFDNGNSFRSGCGRPHDKTCTDGIEAWLNAPAEREGEDE